MTFKLKIFAGLLALAVVLVATGCGDDSATGTTAGADASGETAATTDTADQGATATEGEGEAGGEPLTKAQFIKQANAICAKTKQRQSTAFGAYVQQNKGSFSGDRKSQEKLVLAVAIPPFQQQVEELAALSAPKSDEAEVDEIISSFEEALQASEENPGTLLRGRGEFAEAEKLAAAYGMKACSRTF